MSSTKIIIIESYPNDNAKGQNVQSLVTKLRTKLASTHHPFYIIHYNQIQLGNLSAIDGHKLTKITNTSKAESMISPLPH